MINALKKRKNKIALIIVFSVLTLAALLSFAIFSSLGSSLQSQKAAERFSGDSDERFAQVSAFFPLGKGIDRQGIYNFTKSIESSYVEASLEAKNGGSLYKYAYSAITSINVKGPKGNAEASVIGIGGDFFYFHPLKLVSGTYISENDLMHDKVVLDKEMAWRLFGASNIAGMSILINGKPYVIAGVVDREDDKYSSQVYTLGDGMFMAYDALNDISSTEISTVEIVSADPISGFALDIVEKAFPDALIVENSSRFGFSNEFSILRNYTKRSIVDEAVVLPYWENAARIVENNKAIALALLLIFGIPPVIMLIAAVIIVIKFYLAKLRAFLPAYLEKRNEERYERRKAEKEKIDG